MPVSKDSSLLVAEEVLGIFEDILATYGKSIVQFNPDFEVQCSTAIYKGRSALRLTEPVSGRTVWLMEARSHNNVSITMAHPEHIELKSVGYIPKPLRGSKKFVYASRRQSAQKIYHFLHIGIYPKETNKEQSK